MYSLLLSPLLIPNAADTLDDVENNLELVEVVIGVVLTLGADILEDNEESKALTLANAFENIP